MSQLILIEGTDWWTASWFGAEAKGATPLEAVERLCGRIRSLRLGLDAPRSGEDLGALQSAWPEVRDVVARILQRTPEPAEAPLAPWERPGPTAITEARDSAERRVVRAALDESRGNMTRAAKTLGLSRFGLMKKAARLGIDYRRIKAEAWAGR